MVTVLMLRRLTFVTWAVAGSAVLGCSEDRAADAPQVPKAGVPMPDGNAPLLSRSDGRSSHGEHVARGDPNRHALPARQGRKRHRYDRTELRRAPLDFR